MKKEILLLTVLLIIGTLFISSCNEGEKTKNGNNQSTVTAMSVMAPDFAEKDVFGKDTVSLSAYKGKVILLNFWATWCPPCRAELPDIVKLYNNYKDKMIVIGVSFDDNADVVKEFYNKEGLNYPIIMGTEKINADYGGIDSIPATFVINTNGEVTDKFVGSRSYEVFEKAVKKNF